MQNVINKRISTLIPIYRTIILKFVPIWWLLLSFITLLPISDLQPVNTIKSTFISCIYIPILLFFVPYLALNQLKVSKQSFVEKVDTRLLKIAFIFLVFTFVLNIIREGYIPLFSPSISSIRLSFNFAFITVLTDIILRINFLLSISKYINNLRLSKFDFLIIIFPILYNLATASRGALSEYLFYFLLSYLIKNSSRISQSIKNPFYLSKRKIYFILKILFFGILIFLVFSLFGNLRESNEYYFTDRGFTKFNVYEYMRIKVPLPNFLKDIFSWFWGYFPASIHNLNLLIIENFKNDISYNTLGPILQSLKIKEFTSVDNYLYIGRVNAGTALRVWILDFGGFFGPLFFSIYWSIIAKLPLKNINQQSRTALMLLVIYCGFCIPLASRIEITPFIASILFLYFYQKKIKNT